MITKEQATAGTDKHYGDGSFAFRQYDHTQFHYGNCTRQHGPRGGVTVRSENWRRNGATKTWKKQPHRFRIPIKYGLRGYGYIDETNAGDFHLASECPLNALSPQAYQELEGKTGLRS